MSYCVGRAVGRILWHCQLFHEAARKTSKWTGNNLNQLTSLPLSPNQILRLNTLLNDRFKCTHYHWNASDMTLNHLDSHARWQFMFTTADRNAVVCHSSDGRSQIWKIMEMYLCRQCFISVWALWKIKISLCLWEERGWGEEGPSVCAWMCV